MRYYYIVSAILVNVLCTVCTHAQIVVGAGGGVQFNSHRVDFRSFPGVPSCCPKFQDGSGRGVAFVGIIGWRLSNDLRLELAPGYRSWNGVLRRDESVTLSNNVAGVFEHSVDARLNDIGVDLLASYQVLAPLRIVVGPHVGVLSTMFSQKELITRPDSGLFENSQRSRNVVNDTEIPNASSLNIAAQLGIAADLPLNAQHTLLLSPQLSYVLPLTNIVQDQSWKVSAIRAMVNVLWCPPASGPVKQRQHERRELIDTVRQQGKESVARLIRGREETREETDERDDIVISRQIMHRTDTLLLAAALVAPSLPDVMMTVVGVDVDKRETLSPTLTVEEFRSLPTTPILPYVFFDENDASLAVRYRRLDQSRVGEFSLSQLNAGDRMGCYYDLLNIVGMRLILYPRASLTITGCNADVGSEKSNVALSKQRAEQVRDYLMQTWKIEARRLKVEARSLPQFAANSATSDGAQENRRVEIHSSDPAILAPLNSRDTLRVVTPETIRLQIKDNNPTVVTEWSFDVKKGLQSLFNRASASPLPTVLEWRPNESIQALSDTCSSLDCELKVVNTSQVDYTMHNRIPVKHLSIQQKQTEHRADKEISRYSLLMFNVRSAEISSSDKPLVDLIKSQITAGTVVRITGFADRSGDAKANEQLARDRAQSMARELGVDPNSALVQGMLDTTSYNQNVPEGRMYARTVEIILETPQSAK